MHPPDTFQTAPHVLTKELGPSNTVLLESEQPSGSRRNPAETDASTLHVMATGPQINVYASLPWTAESGGNLDINPSAWQWAHCLTLPLHTLNTLNDSQKSYKWIRYAIGVVTGTEGALSTSPDLLHAMDDDADLPAESVNLYYHTSVEERGRAFPIDPDILRSHLTSDVHTDRRADFREDVAARDSERCVLTGAISDACEAAHLIAHSKGDEYISTFTLHRSRDTLGGDVIQEIDDVRNGIFLNKNAHSRLGKDVAFLMTPNFAMGTNDVDPAAPPNEKRCTAHVFVPATSPTMTGLITNLNPGHPLRLSNPHGDPPAIIFDAVYAGAIVHHFGSQIMKDVVSSAWKNKIHKGGVMSSAGAELKKIVDKRAALAVKTQYEVDKRAERFKRSEVRKSRTLLDTTPSGPDSLDMVMMLPYAFLAENERQAFFMRAREKAEAAEKERLQETVGQWARHVEAST